MTTTTLIDRLPTDMVARCLADEVTRVVATPVGIPVTLDKVEALLAELVRRAEAGDRKAARFVVDHEVDRAHAGITAR